MEAVHITREESDGVTSFRLYVLEGEEVIGHLWWSSHLAGALQPQHKKVQYQPVILDYKGGKLETTDDPVRVGVIHVLRGRGEVKREGHTALYICIYCGHLVVT